MRTWKPGKIWGGAVKKAFDGIYKHGEHSLPLNSAGLSQSENALNPALPLFTGRAQARLSPLHWEADHTLRVVVRRRYAGLLKEHPQRVFLPLQSFGERPSLAFALAIQRNKTSQPRVEGVPLPNCGRNGRHVTQTLQLFFRPPAATGDFRILNFGQPLRRADKVRQAGLPLARPFPVKPVAITDQNALPFANQSIESLSVAVIVDPEECGVLVGQHPQPLQLAVAPPRDFVRMVDLRLSGHDADRLVVRRGRGRYSVYNLLNRSKTKRHAEDRGTEGLDHTPAVGLGSDHLRHNGRESGTETGVLLGRNVSLVHLPALRTAAGVQHQMRHVRFNLWQFDELVRVDRRYGGKGRVAAAAGTGQQRLHVRGLDHGLTMPGMPRLAARTFTLPRLGLSLAQRRIARRRFAGVGRVHADPGFQFIETLATFGQFLDQPREQPQYGLRGICQVLGCDLDIGGKIGWKVKHTFLSDRSGKTLDPVIAYHAEITFSGHDSPTPVFVDNCFFFVQTSIGHFFFMTNGNGLLVKVIYKVTSYFPNFLWILALHFKSTCEHDTMEIFRSISQKSSFTESEELIKILNVHLHHENAWN